MSRTLPASRDRQRLREQSAEALAVQLQAERLERGRLEFRQAVYAAVFVGAAFGTSYALSSHLRRRLGRGKRR